MTDARRPETRPAARPADRPGSTDRLGRLRMTRKAIPDEPLDVVELAGLAMTRAAGAPPIEGNAVTLLRDAGENFPAWKAALQAAERSILFECYIVENDNSGREFAALLAERARAGVRVHVIVDWLGKAPELAHCAESCNMVKKQ